MIIRRRTTTLAAAMAIAVASVGAATRAQRQEAATPETVMVTVHAKAGAEADLARVMLRHWQTVRRLNLVQDTPRLALRGTEGDNLTYFVEIFTWRDINIPDNAPPEIQAIWAEMQKLTEARGGRPGIDISEVSVVPRD